MTKVNINGNDAFATYGIVFDEKAISTLMSYPALKSMVSSESRLENGKRVVTESAPKWDSRQLTLQVSMKASSASQFLIRYKEFRDACATGNLLIHVPDIGEYYHMKYEDMTQYTQYRFGVAKLSIKLTEPNPGLRTEA
jgi:hypothetical protein